MQSVPWAKERVLMSVSFLFPPGEAGLSQDLRGRARTLPANLPIWAVVGFGSPT